LIARVVAYIAPVLIGGGGKPALAGPGAPNIADVKRFQLEDVVRIGPDVRLTATPLTDHFGHSEADGTPYSTSTSKTWRNVKRCP
jgi:hypothetical protein